MIQKSNSLIKHFISVLLSKCSPTKEPAPNFFSFYTIFASICFAMCISLSGYHLSSNISQRYTEFIVGNIAWRAATKYPDIILPALAVIMFIICYFILCLQKYMLNGSDSDADNVRYFDYIVGIACLPAILFLPYLFKTKFDANSLFFLKISGFSIFLIMIGTLCFIIFKNRFLSNKFSYKSYIASSLLIPLFACISAFSLCCFINRLFVYINNSFVLEKSLIHNLTFATFIIVSIFYFLCAFWDHMTAFISNVHLKIIVFSQLLIPFSMVMIMPSPWKKTNNIYYGYDYDSNLIILILLLIGWGLGEIILRIIRSQKTNSSETFFSVISPMTLVAVLFLIKFPFVGTTHIPGDDYHWGEFLIPYFQYKDFGFLPFRDYMPVRGIDNYFLGFLSDIFTAPTSSMMVATKHIVSLGWLIISVYTLRKRVNLLLIFSILLVYPLFSLPAIHLISFIFFIILYDFITKKNFLMALNLWIAFCIGNVLLAPGQGAIWTISTVPTALYCLYKIYRDNIKVLARCLIVWGCIALTLALFTPFMSMIYNAVLYVKDQGLNNATSHGIPWILSFNKSIHSFPYAIGEFFRASFILGGMLFAIFFVAALFRENNQNKKNILFFTSFCLIICLLYIPRATGRIDPGSFTRLSVISSALLILYFPCFLTYQFPRLNILPSCIIALFFSGIMFGSMNLRSILNAPVATANINDSIVVGKDIGLPRLGAGYIKPDHLKRLKKISSTIAEFGKYYDLTNRNAHYFYFNRRCPTESVAVYNMSTELQQKRAVEKLSKYNPDIILAKAASINNDGGKPSLRCYGIYRYLITHFLPFSKDGFIYLLQSEDPRLFSFEKNKSLTTTDMFDKVFRQSNLQLLPSSWGRSYNSLSDKLIKVYSIDSDNSKFSYRFIVQEDDLYKIVDKEPGILLEFENLNLSGRDIGMLIGDFESYNPGGTIADQPVSCELYWHNNFSMSEKTVVRFQLLPGKFIVPLDIAPRWILGGNIKKIRFDIAGKPAGTKFKLSNLWFGQRTISLKIDKIYSD